MSGVAILACQRDGASPMKQHAARKAISTGKEHRAAVFMEMPDAEGGAKRVDQPETP